MTSERAEPDPAALLDATLQLDNQLCFLVAQIHRALNDRYRPVLSRLGLTYPQYLAMLALWEQEPVSVGRLGARLRLDSGTLSPLLKRLEAAGLVTRTRSADAEDADQGQPLKVMSRSMIAVTTASWSMPAQPDSRTRMATPTGGSASTGVGPGGCVRSALQSSGITG